ncbi:unnamed protein product, partial [Mesorhabditis belari]|uniref:UDP-glucuronosyltransferase n=1 Tax=Mesorhabditis belari TaxID=2138241 RepID=A0AAF3EH70_9BILA
MGKFNLIICLFLSIFSFSHAYKTVLQPITNKDTGEVTGVKKAKLITVDQDPEISVDFPAIWNEFRNPWVKEPEFPKLLGTSVHYASQCNFTMNHKELMDQLSGEKFDVGITEMYDHCGIVLLNRIGAKSHVLATSTISMESINQFIGIPNLYSYVPVSVAKASDQMGLKMKIGSIVSMLGLRYYYYRFRLEMDKVIDHHFGVGSSSTSEMIGNADMVLTNSHPYLDFAHPTLEKIVDIGSISVDEPKALDERWLKITSVRSKTILLSFGSVAYSTLMPKEWRDSIVQALKAFPDVTFIWKYEKPEDNFAVSAPNVKLIDWAPQLDLLFAGKIDLFITHGGLGSVYETALAGVPAIFIPLFADQFRNAMMCERKGFGEILPKEKLGEPQFIIDLIKKMLESESYKENAEKTGRRMKSRPLSPREQLVKHIEFAAREGKLGFLDPAGRQMSFIQYYCLDVLGILITFLLICSLFKGKMKND